MKNTEELETLAFESASDLEKWLHKNHESSPGIWLKLFKKSSNVTSVTYVEAVHVALCYGWIDSLVRGVDEKCYVQKLTPRKAKSMWSKINTQRVETLITEGKMKPSGLKEIEEAKADGRWDAAYHSPTTMEVPKDLVKKIATDKKAKEFFESLSKSNKYSIAFKIETAKKPETRAKRLETIFKQLQAGEKNF